MRIFIFDPVSNHHQDLLPDDRKCRNDADHKAIHSALKFTGVPKGKKWVPPPVFSLNPKKPMPDIWHIGYGSDAFAVTPKVLKKTCMFLEMAGELLPLPYKDLTLTICNITECIDCVDSEASQWMQLGPKRKILEKPAFLIDRLPDSTLFKIPEWSHRMLCWERTGDPESEFKACVEANKFKGGFKGKFFELVWESSE